MTTLLQAAESGDLDRVQTLYSTKVEPSQQPQILEAIGAVAAQKNQPAILDWCFSRGLQIPAGSVNNEVFKRAIYGKHIPIFESLVSHGVDLNSQHNESHGDALNVAADHGNVELVRWLLEHGHKPDSKVGNFDSTDAAIKAVAGGKPSLEVLELLIRYGADFNKSGAPIAAAEEGNLEALKVMVKTGKVELERTELWYGVTDRESIDSEGTALYRACYSGQVETARYLIRQGADRDAVDKIGRSCRDAAVANEHEDIVKLLDESR